MAFRELQCVFHKFPKCHMKNMLGDFDAEVGRKDLFQTYSRV
jgi:hypothetical protein